MTEDAGHGRAIFDLANQIDAAVQRAASEQRDGIIAMLSVAFMAGRMLGRVGPSSRLVSAVENAVRLGRLAGEMER